MHNTEFQMMINSLESKKNIEQINIHRSMLDRLKADGFSFRDPDDQYESTNWDDAKEEWENDD